MHQEAEFVRLALVHLRTGTTFNSSCCIDKTFRQRQSFLALSEFYFLVEPYWKQERGDRKGLTSEMASTCSEIYNNHGMENLCEYLFCRLLCLWESSAVLGYQAGGMTGFH